APDQSYIELRAPGRTLHIRPVPNEWQAEVVAADGEFAGSTVHKLLLTGEPGRWSVSLSNRADVLNGCLSIMNLLDPIIFGDRSVGMSMVSEAADARMADIITEETVRDPALEAAWWRFALVDANAKTERSSFERLQKWILAFGLLATILALVQAQLAAGWPSS